MPSAFDQRNKRIVHLSICAAARVSHEAALTKNASNLTLSPRDDVYMHELDSYKQQINSQVLVTATRGLISRKIQMGAAIGTFSLMPDGTKIKKGGNAKRTQ